MWLALVVVWCSAAHPPVEKRAPRDQQERCGWKQGGGTQLARRGFYKRRWRRFCRPGTSILPLSLRLHVFCVRCSESRRPASLHALQQSTTMLRLLVLLLPAAIIMSIIQASVGFLVTCSPADRLLPVGAESTSAPCVCIPPFVKCCFTAVHVFLRRVCVHALLSSHHACLYFRFSRELAGRMYYCMHSQHRPLFFWTTYIYLYYTECYGR